MRRLLSFAYSVMQTTGVLQERQGLSSDPLPVYEEFLNIQHKEEKEDQFTHSTVY